MPETTSQPETLELLRRLLRAADKQASVVHDLIYQIPFDVKAASDAVWVLHGILRALDKTNPPWCSVCTAVHNFGEGDKCGLIVSTPSPVAERLEQIAERIMWPAIGKVAPAIYREMVNSIVAAVRDAYKDSAYIAETCTQDEAARDEPFRIAQTIRAHAAIREGE